MQAIRVDSNKIHGLLSVFVFPDTTHPDKDVWVAYCPELDLAGTDHGKDAAIKSLKYVLTDYFDYTLKHGTLEKDLLSHGWRKYKNGKLVEPTYENLLKTGKLKSVISQDSYLKYSIPINV